MIIHVDRDPAVCEAADRWHRVSLANRIGNDCLLGKSSIKTFAFGLGYAIDKAGMNKSLTQ